METERLGGESCGCQLLNQVERVWMWGALCLAVASGVFMWCRTRRTAFHRERVARDLHDNLLQGVQGLLLKLHVIAQKFPEADSQRHALYRAISDAETLLAEGRERIVALGRTFVRAGDFPRSVSALGADVQAVHGLVFRLCVEGHVFILRPAIFGAALDVTRSMISEAIAVASGGTLAVDLEYGLRHLRIAFHVEGGSSEDDYVQSTKLAAIHGWRLHVDAVGSGKTIAWFSLPRRRVRRGASL